MSSKITRQAANDLEKEFLNTFNSLCQTRSSWQVWSDFITAVAITLANSVDECSELHNKREAEYEDCIKRLGGIDVPVKMFSIIISALEENPEQDFLGNMFMKLELGNHWKGQFFTPYSICRMMAEMNAPRLESIIEEKGWVSVNDPACGAGATLIAMANTMRNYNVNYQNHALFVAQDIDRIAGMMCFIQLSLLGCAGYVVIANTLSNPLVSKDVLCPMLNESQEIWYTPMLLSDVWIYRRKYHIMDLFLQNI